MPGSVYPGEDRRDAYFLAFKNLMWRGRGREWEREGKRESGGREREDIHRKRHKLQTVMRALKERSKVLGWSRSWGGDAWDGRSRGGGIVGQE